MLVGLLSPLLRWTRSSMALGLGVSAACLVIETTLIHLIKDVVPLTSLGQVYLPGVLLVATMWGLVLAVPTALMSAMAFHWFHLWPVDDRTEWVILPTFLVVGVVAGSIAGVARSLAAEARARYREADLAAEQARVLLCAEDLRSALPETSRRLARALGLPQAMITTEPVTAGEGHMVFPLLERGARLGTLIVPGRLSPGTLRRLRGRVVPSLTALLAAAREREAMIDALESSRDDLRRLAERQAALRRVATLVARAGSPEEIFHAVAGETGRVVAADCVTVTRFETDARMTVVGSWCGGAPEAAPSLGSRWAVGAGTVPDLVARTGRPARGTLDGHAGGGIAAWAPAQGLTCALGCPIVVQGRLWGTVIAYSASAEPYAGDAERHMSDFTELAATAIANAQTLAELAASRARVVAATDETRRRIERDLHDGAQQHLISLALELRTAALSVPPGQEDLGRSLDQVVRGLGDIVENLRELSRGLHPAILSVGGLEPALRALTRRSAVPAELDLHGVRRLPERVEVAVYYVVSEALTNIAKHARASLAHIELRIATDTVELSIRDDGVGGGDPGRGSGLIGLKDRVEALGGTLEIASPAGEGTILRARIPAAPPDPPFR